MKRSTLLFVSVLLLGFNGALFAQCPDTIISNGGFEQGIVDWWTWHGGAGAESYAFYTSDDAFAGDSSVVIDILEDADSIAGGAAEYNSRPQTNPVTGGEFYELSFAAKSTVAGAFVRVNIKDENDSWFTVHSEAVAIDTVWGIVSTVFQADVNRADVHVELTVFNGDIHVPYKVFLDEVCMAQTVVTTTTCADNLVDNPGFEDGAYSQWWNWHSNNPDAYEFLTSSDSYIGDSAAMIRVVKSGVDITGPGEYNNRPDTTSALVDSQNYKVTFFAKSTEPNTEVQVWVKDEFDGWTTIHTETFTVDTTWTESSTIFTADADRDDVHLEIKVYNASFGPYDVIIDEVSMCPTTEDPNSGGPAPGPVLTFGTSATPTTCSNNMAPGNEGFEPPNDTMNWDLWDGSDTDELSSFHVDPVLPNSGLNSVRIDVGADHDVAEFHHRFGPRFTVDDGKDYTFTVWLRSDLPAGDSVNVFSRVVRDTDWSAQTVANFIVTENNWLNFSHTFTADGSWNNAFLEFKCQRWTGFTSAYSLWFDDVSICSSDSATVTSLEDLAKLGLEIKVFPNPLGLGNLSVVEINSPSFLQDAKLSIVDIMGRQIWQDKINITAGVQRMDLPTQNLAAGMYIVQIQHEGFAKNLKLQVVNR
ncbi:MAG: carbohydrate binding domain-containing protein [Bacteroidota bacterium]